MINYAGMKAEENKSEDFGQLPAGPYVAKCLKTEIDGLEPDQSLVLYLDVSEGEYKDFFRKKFDASKKAGSKYGEVKFKGVLRLRIPNSNNPHAQYPETDLRRFNDMIFRFEKSNPTFHWTGDETKLVGLTVGINMQEDEYNGNKFTRIGKLETAQDVMQGLVKGMKPRKRNEKGQQAQAAQAPVDQQTGFPIVEPDDELPF